MATLKLYDGADEFRMEIIGKFAGHCVDDAADAWRSALSELRRKITVDISRLNGFDAAGRKLLTEMHQHGTNFGAGTPLSLVFLSEIMKASRHTPEVLSNS